MHQYHKWLRSFYAVALKGSFTLAAEYLCIGQPTVSEQVKCLERVFKVELFHRNGNVVELSQAGQQLFEITKPMFKLEEEAVSLLQSFQSHKAGMFRIGAVSPPIAMNLTYQLRQNYPDIEFQTSFCSASETLERLFNFDIDLAILSQTKFDPRFYTALYKRIPVVAVVRDDHPWALKQAISIEEIQQQAVILRERGSQTRQVVENACNNRGIEINCTMQLNSREAIFHAVSQGIGISFVVEVEFIHMPRLKAVSFIDQAIFLDYYLCCLNIRKDRPMIEDLFKNQSLKIS